MDYPRYVWQMVTGFRVAHERSFAAKREADITPYLPSRGRQRVLDLANGRLRPQYALLKAAGYRVFGIDLANRPIASRVNFAYGIARWLYYWKLGIPYEPPTHRTIVCGNVGILPFQDHSFDLVTSVAALEHFLDIPSVVAELYRVLCPGGIVWVSIHLFTALSGGHNLSFVEIPQHTLPKNIAPWDHLRKRRLPFHVPLNEWRKDQYLRAFSGHFEILNQYCAMREGEELLTPEVLAELHGYSRDELTCRDYIIVARKPVNSGIESRSIA